MACTFESFFLAGQLPAIVEEAIAGSHRQIYEANRRRIYALSFRMTDNELMAEQVTADTFRLAFSVCDEPSSEFLDDVLVSEIRELMPLGMLSLDCATSTTVVGVRRNIRRVHLEQAVVQLPPTERLVFLMHDVEGYDHGRIGRCIGLTDMESKRALHQARLRLRELLATMVY